MQPLRACGVVENDDAVRFVRAASRELHGSYAAVREKREQELLGVGVGLRPFRSDDGVQHDHGGRIDAVPVRIGQNLDEIGGAFHAEPPAHDMQRRCVGGDVAVR
ncbi:hypothetical protein CFP71_10030 [Amycolatopsis thailandensis]|uniref:Uncharacterized protein n=1 Tax=Amycolatopsis thailandensis TaxID=589330 RepID=A0A229SEK6_9PSEU|nr:hypothetical protein CFP71_10030 [Amycolatopsis thailandensis]